MPVPERHVLVCTGSDCRKRGGKKTCKAFKAALEQAGLKRAVRVVAVDCLDQCGHGPMALVYPDGVWYAKLQAEEVKEVVERHLAAGKPVSAKLYRRAHAKK
jgi:(2Fe-2S) ferredoxin